MSFKKNQSKLDVYSEGRKRRLYVGCLTYTLEDDRYTFEYDESYLHLPSAIQLGPDLALDKRIHVSEPGKLFPSFADRLPDPSNPAYQEYCASQGISPQETNPIILLGTIGRRGPSTFVFESVHEPDQDVIEQLRHFRQDLDLSFADFADAFDINVLSLKRIEARKSTDRNILQLIRIYLNHPKVSLEQLRKTGGRLHQEVHARLFRHFTDQSGAAELATPAFDNWMAAEHQTALQAMKEKTGFTGYMEISARLMDDPLLRDQEALLQAADKSQIHTFGWPIGIVLHQNETKPVPYKDGVRAEIHAAHSGNDKSYDYWNLKRNGDYFVFSNLFEDRRRENHIFLDSRTVRVAEALLHIVSLYRNIGIKDNTMVNIKITHGGLRGRILGSANANRSFSYQRIAKENDVTTDIHDTLINIDRKLNSWVYTVIADLTVLFDFFRPAKDQIVDQLVNDFREGRIS